MNKESLAEQQYVPSPEEQVILRAEAHAFSVYNDKEKPAEWLAAHNGFLAGYAAAVEDEAARLACEVSALREEVAELRAWKESAIKHTPPLQEIGKELGLKLGSDIPSQILPKIQELKRERDAATNLLIELRDIYLDVDAEGEPKATALHIIETWMKVKEYLAPKP